jgi:DNA polymerase III subunit epsilon
MPKHFAIIDVETTGGNPQKDKITEIGLILHDGHQVLHSYNQLINPERSIPSFITGITGITDQMVQDAPKFYEIAKEIVELTADAFFVAHNARFDYGFFVNEFKHLGYSYNKQTYCTVQMSRRAFPGLNSYSLGNLVRYFEIPLDKHHRALDDAMATTMLFEKIIQSEYYTKISPLLSKKSIREIKLPASIKKAYLDSIPDTTGIYYFYNKENQIIYVGKSVELRSRIWSHFTDQTERGMKLQTNVADISYTETGSELAALLYEAIEIRKHKPEYNKALRNLSFPFSVVIDGCQMGMPYIMKTSKIENQQLIKKFSKQERAETFLKLLLNKYDICICQAGLKHHHGILPGETECFANNDALMLNYNLIELNNYLSSSFFIQKAIITEGRNEDESFVVLVDENNITHMGYTPKDDYNGINEDTVFYLDAVDENPELMKILDAHLKKHPQLKPIELKQFMVKESQ